MEKELAERKFYGKPDNFLILFLETGIFDVFTYLLVCIGGLAFGSYSNSSEVFALVIIFILLISIFYISGIIRKEIPMVVVYKKFLIVNGVKEKRIYFEDIFKYDKEGAVYIYFKLNNGESGMYLPVKSEDINEMREIIVNKTRGNH